ncbi:unnamed protein product [Fusarium equiseti]|uniref:Polyamine transport protein n=1 Tax=Fusarium equiseti TaxID=61235 RepID=A0A8J2ND02_FUSEQ|nr:unnamed protein product [Fusarium equiseti]
MFSTLIGHTRGLLPPKESKGQAVADIGDFDHTPPPSGRASVELLKSKEKREDTASEQLLQKSSFDIVIGNDDSSSPMLAPVLKKPNTTSAETSGASLGLPFHKASSAQNETVMDSMRKRSWNKIQAQTSPNQPSLFLSGLGRELHHQSTPCLEEQSHLDELPSWSFRLINPRVSQDNNKARYRRKPSQEYQTDYFSGKVEDSSCAGNGSHPVSLTPETREGRTKECVETITDLSNVEIPESRLRKLDSHDSGLRDSNAQISPSSGPRETSTEYAPPPGRSRSSGSIMDYLWKNQWLKRLSGRNNSYDPVLTDLPPRTKSVRTDDRRPSEPVLPSSHALHRPSAWPILPGKTNHHVDDTIFKRAFNDLERLVDEALSLAVEVADHPEHDNSYSRAEQNDQDLLDESDISGNAQQATRAALLCDDGQDCAERPKCRRAATYTSVPRRPRLTDVVESYSGTYQELRKRSRIERTQQESFSRRTSRTILSQLPSQATNMGSKRKSVTLEDLLISKLLPKTDEKSKNPQGTHVVHRRVSATNAPTIENGTGQDALPEHDIAGRRLHYEHGVNLRKRSHVSLRDTNGFNLPKSHIRQPIARDWSSGRKRFVASVACLSTALIGVLLGIYTGLVPSIQYYIVDQSHVAVHGNTGCFLALALPSFFLWPLPLLHGRKPYIMSSLIIAMPLLFPQAIAVSNQRLTNTASWRTMLLVCRTLMGGSLGFASMNFHSVLTDLFGASLMCRHPHQEVVDQFDARRHGGGMGIWLGIWTWCWIGSLGVGFLIGAAIIDKHPPAWGFYVSIIMIAVVLILNVICPEVRRSAFRRSIAEVRTGGNISRRLARGEVMMHRVKTGPKWWGQEAYHGVRLSLEMLEQPGFAVMALYVAWIYAQIVLVIILMGSLVSRLYHLRSPYVGLHVAAVAVGALLAIPFQKASIFSRSRRREGKSNRETIGKRVAWSSHLIRRAIFTISLPIGAACYAAVSSGPPINSGVPAFFALCIGFLSCLAISECNGLIMETFDTSDLSPGMVGRHHDPSGQDQRRTNYSSFPRVTAGFAVIHSFSYILAAGSTALGGHVTRKLGQQVATSVVAGILFLLTVLLLLVLIRFKNVLIIPRSKSEEMERLTRARRQSSKRRATMPGDVRALMEEDRAWQPAMTGNPMGKNRRMNVLEIGNLTRWQDIRRRNRLIDAGTHINRDTLDHGLDAMDVALETQVDDMRQNDQGFFRRGTLRKHGSHSRRSNQTRSSEQTFHDLELDMFDPIRKPGESYQQPRELPENDCVMGQPINEEVKTDNQAGPSSSRKDA